MAKKNSFNEQEQHIMINNDVREDGTLIDNKSKTNFTIINKAALKNLFVCRNAILVLRVGSVNRDFFLFWWRSALFPGP